MKIYKLDDIENFEIANTVEKFYGLVYSNDVRTYKQLLQIIASNYMTDTMMKDVLIRYAKQNMDELTIFD